MAIEFGTTEFALEDYLALSSPKVFEDHDHLSHFLQHIDPRYMIPFEPLEERVMPLTDQDMLDLKRYAFLQPSGSIMRINFRNRNGLLIPANDAEWWEVIGENVDEIKINKFNIELKRTELPEWNLLYLHQTKAYDDYESPHFHHFIGWIQDEEITRLIKLGEIINEEE